MLVNYDSLTNNNETYLTIQQIKEKYHVPAEVFYKNSKIYLKIEDSTYQEIVLDPEYVLFDDDMNIMISTKLLEHVFL